MGTNALFHERPVFEVLETVDSLLDRLFPITFQTGTDWRAAKLKEFIDRDPDKIRGSLDAACKELDLPLSDRHARRLFKFSVGMGIREYARHRCLVRAARQLQATNMAVKAIAADAGYQYSRDFARSFEHVFRVKPTEFRKLWRPRQMRASGNRAVSVGQHRSAEPSASGRKTCGN